ncbi:MotA/TolQ/ExbB proton channel family protein [Methylococcus sp. EFPC2]|nr:MotA/TolQ/ExbB proton channel family protein [Methylococcus sp. EFPC2]
MSETAIVDGTLCALGCFSLLTWSVILLKAGEVILSKLRNHRYIKQFVSGEDKLPDGPDSDRIPAGRVLQAGRATLAKASLHLSLNPDHHEAWYELIERAMRQQILKEKARMESGLGWLASIGSTSPFVGLFGTVWGIMHALKDIGANGNASLEVVAGPIGEALIATALGIAVAIPAVIAYNFFLRQNRRIIATLDHFASDFLHSSLESHLMQTTVNEHGRTVTE